MRHRIKLPAPALRLAFMRTTRTGGSQKARRRALAHDMRHRNQTSCMEIHAQTCRIHMACTCASGSATGAQGFPVRVMSKDTFFRPESVCSVGSNVPANIKNCLPCNAHGCAGSQRRAEMRQIKPIPKRSGNRTLKQVQRAGGITVHNM